MTKTALLYITVGLALAAAMLGAAAWLLRSGVDLPRLQQQVATLRLVGAAVQAVVLLLIVLGWRRLVLAGQRRGIVTPAELPRVLALRPKVLAVLLAYWLLVPVGPDNLIAWAQHLAAA